MIVFTVYEKRAYIDVHYGGPYPPPKKNGYNRNNSQSFKVRTLNSVISVVVFDHSS